MTLFSIVIWILFGAIVGAAIHLFDPHKVRGGLFSTVLVGMCGAVLGGIAATLFFNTPIFAGVLSDTRIATTLIVFFCSIILADTFRSIYTRNNQRRNKKLHIQ